MKRKLNWIFSASFGALFLVLLLLVRVADVGAIGPAGTSIGLSHLNQAVADGIGVHMIWYDITDYLGYFAILLVCVFGALGAFQLFKGRSFAKVDRELYFTGGLYVAILILYIFFELVIVNYRTILMPGKDFPEASFPSSHTVLACTVFGSTAMLLPKYLKKPIFCKILQAVCEILAVLTVVGRLISGVHWFTDILAGALVSLALLFLYREMLNLKKDSVTE